MKALIAYRVAVKSAADQKELMKISDELRDEILPKIGIRLEDRGDGSVWGVDTPENLEIEKQKKIDAKLKKEEEKRKKAEEALKKKSTPGKELFRVLEQGDFT